MPAARRFDLCSFLLMASVALVTAGCYIKASLPVPAHVAQSCPDFSGEYFMAGEQSSGEFCDLERWLDTSRPGLPHLHGPPPQGFSPVGPDSILVVSQRKCEELQLLLVSPPVANGAKPWSHQSHLDLVRRRARTHVEWTPGSLSFRDRVKIYPTISIPLPIPLFAHVGVDLSFADAGDSIRYRTFFHATGDPTFEASCDLPKATQDRWAQVGLKALWRKLRDLPDQSTRIDLIRSQTEVAGRRPKPRFPDSPPSGLRISPLGNDSVWVSMAPNFRPTARVSGDPIHCWFSWLAVTRSQRYYRVAEHRLDHPARTSFLIDLFQQVPSGLKLLADPATLPRAIDMKPDKVLDAETLIERCWTTP